MYWSSMTFHFLYFFDRMVLNLLFCGVTVKMIQSGSHLTIEFDQYIYYICAFLYRSSTISQNIKLKKNPSDLYYSESKDNRGDNKQQACNWSS